MDPTLLAALRELWVGNGAPSYRVMRDRIRAKYQGTGPSHMAIYKALNGNSNPTLDTIMLIVEALGGDGEFFREMWIEARLADDLPVPAAASRLDEILSRLARIEDRLEGIEKLLADQELPGASPTLQGS